MTETIKKLLDLYQFEYVVKTGGVELTFLLRRFTHTFAGELHGSRAFGLINPNVTPEQREATAKAMTLKEQNTALVDCLRVGMVSPRLGDITSVEEDTVAFRDLGEIPMELFTVIMESGGTVENFTDTSSATVPDG